MPQLHHLPADSQVRKACKMLLRHIHRHGLAQGDRLPTQMELRQHTEFSNDTLSSAMQYLTEDGVLVRRTGLGTVVAEPRRSLDGLWTVGLAQQRQITSNVPFYAQLANMVQEALAAAGCRSQLHLQRYQTKGSCGTASFHLLEHDVAAGRLDGVLTLASIHRTGWDGLVRQGVPLVHVGSWEEAPCGVVIDRYPLVRQAVNLLVQQGARRLALVSMYERHHGGGRYWRGYRDGLAAHGLTPTDDQHVMVGEGIPAGADAARQLLAMSDRPTGLIVVDDRIAMGLTAALREQPDYRPQLVVQTNLQAPLAFALPVTRCEVDIAALARAAVALLIERMANPASTETVQFIAPRLATRSTRT